MNRFAFRCPLIAGPALFAFIVVAALAFPLPASGQKRPVPIEADNHAFRFILDSLGLEPLTNFDQLTDSHDRTILIILGNTRMLDRIIENHDLITFVNDGGAILVATDHRSSDAFGQVFGTGVKGNFFYTHPDRAYLEKPECPFVMPLDGSKASRKLFASPNGLLKRVATNRPSYLVPRDQPTKLESLALLQGYEIDDQGTEGPKYEQKLFAAGAELGNGRVLILADHSVFINEMMLQADNDNFNFAYNCLVWLQDGKRTRALFYDENEIVGDFKVPFKIIKEFPVPPIEVMDQLMAKLEEENIFNRWILGPNPEIRFPLILRILAVTLTAVLVLVGFYRLLQNHHRIEIKAPLFAKAAAGLAPASGVLAQRHQALIREDNLWEAGRHLCRDWFADHLQGTPATPPRISVKATWWQRRALTQKVNALWKLAYGPPGKLSAYHFARAVADLCQVEAAWTNGSLHFEDDVRS